MSFPDLPFIPELPQHRAENMTVRQVLDQAASALRTAREALIDLEEGMQPKRQFADRRQVAIESQRSTYVLLKLKRRVVGWEAWWSPRLAAMRADPLVEYFHILRNKIEKEGHWRRSYSPI